MTILCHNSCSTCAKALQWLKERGVAYTLRDIKTQNPTREELAAWWQQSGFPLKRFFNTSGLVYKNLGLSKKLPDMPPDEQLALLATDGMLVKRPLVVGDNFVLTGFKPQQWAAAFGVDA